LYAGDGNNSSKGKEKQKTEQKSLVKHLNREEFKKLVVNVDAEGWNYLGDKPCVLDFYANWCGPCRMISPFLDDLSKEYKDQIYIYKINIDEEKELARYFGASSIPLLIFIPKEGQPQASRGALPKDEIKNAINTVLLANKKK
jgi:thioredoxin